MKVLMVNDMGNCFKVAETANKVYELERLGFKKCEEPKPIAVSEQKTSKKPTTKKAVKKNG